MRRDQTFSLDEQDKEVLSEVLGDGWEQLVGKKFVNSALVFSAPRPREILLFSWEATDGCYID